MKRKKMIKKCPRVMYLDGCSVMQNALNISACCVMKKLMKLDYKRKEMKITKYCLVLAVELMFPPRVFWAFI